MEDLLRLLPGKGRLAAAAQYVGQQSDVFVNLVNQNLRGIAGVESLGRTIDTVLTPVLPTRTV